MDSNRKRKKLMSTGTPEKKSKLPTKHLENLKTKTSKLNVAARIPEKNLKKKITIENPIPKSISESESNSDEEILEIEEEDPNGNKKSSQEIITRNPEKHTKIEICPEYLTLSKVKTYFLFFLYGNEKMILLN